MKKFPYGLARNSKIIFVLGIVMAAVSLLLGYIWFSSSKAMLLLSFFFSALFFVVGFLKITATTETAAKVINYFWGFAAIAVVLGPSLPSEMISGVVFKILLNCLCAVVILSVMFAVTANWKVAVNVSICILTLLIVINAVVLSFRGKEFGPMDILSAKTAFSVAGQYKLKITRRLFLTCIAFLAVVMSQFSIPAMPKYKISKKYLRLGAVGVMLLASLTVMLGSTNIRLRNWSNEGSKFNGYLLNFYIGIREAHLKAPENYSIENLDMYAQQYDAQADTVPTGKKPNIIVIMDESFADFNVYGKTLSTNIPVTPFIDSLTENTVKGYALTSVLAAIRQMKSLNCSPAIPWHFCRSILFLISSILPEKCTALYIC